MKHLRKDYCNYKEMTHDIYQSLTYFSDKLLLTFKLLIAVKMEHLKYYLTNYMFKICKFSIILLLKLLPTN